MPKKTNKSNKCAFYNSNGDLVQISESSYGFIHMDEMTKKKAELVAKRFSMSLGESNNGESWYLSKSNLYDADDLLALCE